MRGGYGERLGDGRRRDRPSATVAPTPACHAQEQAKAIKSQYGWARRRLRIGDLPHDLNEACKELEKNDVISAALGTHIASHFLEAKRQEWREYISQVSAWELDNYLAKYWTPCGMGTWLD